jgi:nucleoside 2-deoxyribosyltransferase
MFQGFKIGSKTSKNKKEKSKKGKEREAKILERSDSVVERLANFEPFEDNSATIYEPLQTFEGI